MRRAAALATTGFLLLGLAACGGGDGGDASAFCDDLEDFVSLVEDTNLDQRSGIEDVKDALNELQVTAPSGDPLDNVRAVLNAIVEDNQRGEELFDTVNDELEDQFEDCDLDEPEAPATTTTTEATTTTEGGANTTEGPTTTLDDDPELAPEDLNIGSVDAIPAGVSPEFQDAVAGCFGGIGADCDDAFFNSAIDSPEETYGFTCGGRIDPQERVALGIDVRCDDLLLNPVPVLATIVNTADAQGCFNGDMLACDALFNGAAPGSDDQLYGALCAGRVLRTDRFCVDIFGDFSLT